MLATSRWVVAAAALFAASNAATQSVVTQHILSLTAARAIAEAALAECASRGFRTSVAVVDRSGDLLVVLRHELSHPVTVEMARGNVQTPSHRREDHRSRSIRNGPAAVAICRDDVNADRGHTALDDCIQRVENRD